MQKKKSGKYIQVVVLGVIFEGKKLLLTKRVSKNKAHNGCWQLPGGGLEFGESPDQTIVREIKEELGLDVNVVRFLPWVSTKIQGDWQGVFLVYLCKVKRKGERIVLNEESSDYGWFDLSSAEELPLLPGLNVFFKFLEKHLKDYENK
ncbi:MAG: hypothetical protein KatS3mg090_0136 [Patescibacteria group bacterium]|nr:MAG: hypothetical protein KatS3mg090_0136 [Patescibacteria group bacterium]